MNLMTKDEFMRQQHYKELSNAAKSLLVEIEENLTKGKRSYSASGCNEWLKSCGVKISKLSVNSLTVEVVSYLERLGWKATVSFDCPDGEFRIHVRLS